MLVRMKILGPIVAGLLAIACVDDSVTGPATRDQVQPQAQLSFSNAPLFPNVIRFESGIGGGFIADPTTDLLVFAGLPENPADAVDCGGTDPGDQGSFQIVGLESRAQALKLLAKGNVHLHVYQLSTFDNFCTSTPIAQGTGRLVVNDNDIAVSGTRVNSFGASITGSVTLTDGSIAGLSAHIHTLIYPDGSEVVTANAVSLSRM
jgi:hypothetical protein